MYDLQATLVSFLPNLALADGTGADSTVKAAIVAGLALVCATGITAFASTFQRNRQPVPVEPDEAELPIVQELRRRAQKAESELSAATQRIDTLEMLCWDNQINPHTRRAIR